MALSARHVRLSCPCSPWHVFDCFELPTPIPIRQSTQRIPSTCWKNRYATERVLLSVIRSRARPLSNLVLSFTVQSQKHDCQHCSKDGFSSSSWAIQQLSADGEDPVGPIKAPQYLVVALALLNKPLGLQVLSPEPSTAPQCAATTLGTSMTTLGSSPEEAAIQSSIIAAESASPGVVWWAARAVFLQQRLLPRPSLSLQRALVHLLATAAAPASEAALQEVAPLVTQPGSVPPTARILNAALNAARQIESSLVWLEYRHVSTASEHAACALRELNMQISTVGALGKRTEAQQSAKAQLILHVDWQSEGGEDTGRKQQGMLEGCGWQGYPAQEVWPQAEQQKGSGWDGWVDDSGVRHVPQLQNGAGMPLVAGSLLNVTSMVCIAYTATSQTGILATSTGI